MRQDECHPENVCGSGALLSAIPEATICTKYLIDTQSKHHIEHSPTCQNTAIHNSIVIKEYNNNHVTRQPRVLFPPGPPQQQPTTAPPGPPLTRSRAQAASLAPEPLVTPAPARALSTPSSITLTVTSTTPPPADDTQTKTQPPPLPQRGAPRDSPLLPWPWLLLPAMLPSLT